jgi:hypothetical protein
MITKRAGETWAEAERLESAAEVRMPIRCFRAAAFAALMLGFAAALCQAAPFRFDELARA